MTPQRSAQKWATFTASIGFASWFFGNLYEAIVFSPNWLTESARALDRLNEFFVHTSPTAYFVPPAFAGTVAVWGLALANRVDALRRGYAWASLFAALAMGLNAFVVLTVLPQMFGDGRTRDETIAHAYCWRWNALNSVRMLLVAATAACLFDVFRSLDRARSTDGREPARL